MPQNHWSSDAALLRELRVPLMPPGVFLRDHLLRLLDMELEDASDLSGIPYDVMMEIVQGEQRVDVELAMMLARLHSLYDADFWLALQEGIA